MTTLDLPYFDQLLEALEAHPDGDLAAALGRHVHWGCFDATPADVPPAGAPAEPPTTRDPALPSAGPGARRYAAAAARLTERIAEAARLCPGHDLLDVGCGFGGTLEQLSRSAPGGRRVGLNIDVRQLRRATVLALAARNGAAPSAPAQAAAQAAPAEPPGFVAGDGCALPVPDASFDTVLAVECVFHFPSRRRFLREAARVLRPGGRLGISDFVVADGAHGELARFVASTATADSGFYGTNSNAITSAGYARMARGAGLAVVVDDDITEHTLPTYPALRDLYRSAGMPDGVAAMDHLEALARRGLVQYRVLAFERPGGSTGPPLR